MDDFVSSHLGHRYLEIMFRAESYKSYNLSVHDATPVCVIYLNDI